MANLLRKQTKKLIKENKDYDVIEKSLVTLNGKELREGIDYTIENDELKFSEKIKKDLEKKNKFSYSYSYYRKVYSK